MKNIILSFLDNIYNQDWVSYFLYGLSFILGGFIILFFPEILIVLIAAVLFVIGAFIIGIAFQMKKSQNKYHSIKININD